MEKDINNTSIPINTNPIPINTNPIPINTPINPIITEPTNPIISEPTNPIITEPINTTTVSDKPEKVPNSIIFYIKTRIPNFYKINFMPQMLVPNVKSDKVFINPLVEYTRQGIKNLPYNAPKETVLTQFFMFNQFETMINRILSSFTSMQRERTYTEAKTDGVIDTNIELTVKTLFNKNNVFYINDKPYTIIDYHYHKGEWETDKKPIDQLVGLTGDNKNVEDEAEKELAALDESLRYGNASA